MSLTEFFSKLKRYNQNANVIFDEEEPIGRPTDLVMPRKHWFERPASSRRRRAGEKISPLMHSTTAAKRS